MQRERSYEVCRVLLLALLSLVLRMLPAKNSLSGGEIQFFSYDSFYHMRRIFYTTENFPHTLWFDSYLNHPFGLEITWPPLFDQIVTAVALLLGGLPRGAEIAGAIIPPILGSFTILLVYLLAKKLFGTRVAFLSAFLLAIDTKHIGRTHFGLPDHDPLELLLILGAVLLIAYALTERKRNLWFGAAAGILLAAVSYTWIGAPIYMIAILIYAMIQITIDLRKNSAVEDTIFPLAAAFGAAVPLMLPFWYEAWLSPSFIGALASLMALAFLYFLSRLFVAKRVPWQAFVPIVAIFCYMALIFCYATEIGRDAYYLLREGINYFVGSDLARVGIQEAMPLISVYKVISLPILGLIFAIGGFIILGQSIKLKDNRKDHLLFLIWAGLSIGLMIYQVRFLFLFSISGSILVAILFFWGMDRIRSLERSKKVDHGTVKVVGAIILLVLVIPFVINLPGVARYKPEISSDWGESLDWVRENTPETAGFERGIETGDYGILSWWDYGNWILHKSRRPVVANNFQAGAEDSARFFLAETEEEAMAIAENRKVRYVITDSKMVYIKLPAIARWINKEPGSYINITADSDKITYEHSTRFLRTVLAKLHLRDSTDLCHFRLVYESKTSSGVRLPASEVKVFELVSGAKISGTTPYDSPMGVILEITSNQGRRFQYYNSVMPVEGHYEIIVPYSTEGAGEVRSLGPYLLGPLMDVPGGKAKDVEVREEDVLEGRTIEVNF